ncbi:MAG: hypothetical protein ACHQYQ_00300 [Bacteriovoracales bacterium]|jgi:hypothetical protein
MKNGFFSLILVLAFVKPLFADETPTSDYPEGDVEKFFTRIKTACVNPQSAGNQLPPDHIMIECKDAMNEWVPSKVGLTTRNLPRLGSADISVFCDKDLGKLRENFSLALEPEVTTCPKYEQVLVTRSMTVNKITCGDVAQIKSATDFCDKILDQATPKAEKTGKTADLCGRGTGQEPPTGGNLPSPSPQQPYASTLNYNVKM